MEIETSHWDLPTTSTAGYGSNLVRVPGTTSVLSTLPGGRMYLCDVLTGEIRTGQRLAGELRAVVFDGGHVGRADGAWALATFGLCRISLASLTRTGENIRQGLGKYQGRMVALSHDVLGISSFYGKSLILVSRHDGTVLKRLRMGAPALVYPLPGGRHRCWSPHNAVATDLDLASARCVARHPLPYGKGPVLIGDQVLALTGEREDMPGVPDVWDVRSRHVTTFDAWTLTELHRGARSPSLPPEASTSTPSTSTAAVSVARCCFLNTTGPSCRVRSPWAADSRSSGGSEQPRRARRRRALPLPTSGHRHERASRGRPPSCGRSARTVTNSLAAGRARSAATS